MVPSAKRRRVFREFFFAPKWFRFLRLTRFHGVPLGIGKKKRSILHPLEDDENPAFASNEVETKANFKKISFVAPQLDDSRLIIEEVEMGGAKGPKSQLGSKVTVQYEYKSDAGVGSGSVKCDFVLGNSEVLGGYSWDASKGQKKVKHTPPLCAMVMNLLLKLHCSEYTKTIDVIGKVP